MVTTERQSHKALSVPDRDADAPSLPISPTSTEWALRRRLLELLSRPSQPQHMTYEEFLAWADEDTLAEWVDGEVIMTSPASRQHQVIANFLLSVIRTYVEERNLGLVISAPFQLRLARSGREPDLLFLAKEHLERLRETYIDGPADLVVEIVSPESAGRDRGDKFYEYEQAGIAEYWLVDAGNKRAEFYQLGSEGLYQLVPPDSAGVYRSRAIAGLWLRVAWLWETPPLLAVLRELALLP